MQRFRHLCFLLPLQLEWKQGIRAPMSLPPASMYFSPGIHRTNDAMLAAPRNRLVDSHFYASLLVMAVACAAAIPAQADVLVRHEQATPLGLERAWFAQARVDLSRNRIRHWTL